LAVAESQGINSELIPKIATGFCSGIARTGSLCGALSGAIMGLGLLAGRAEPGASVEEIYAQVQDLISQFEGNFGAVHCLELTGVHLGTEDGQVRFRESDQIRKCLEYAEEATRMVLQHAV
jgi:C_GCAxxG_C_C family probable redox protein